MISLQKFLPILLISLTLLLMIFPVIFNIMLRKIINYKLKPNHRLKQHGYKVINQEHNNIDLDTGLNFRTTYAVVILTFLCIIFELAVIFIMPYFFAWLTLSLKQKLIICLINLILAVSFSYVITKGKLNFYDK